MIYCVEAKRIKNCFQSFGIAQFNASAYGISRID